MSNDSSSSEEETERFREAVDEKFLPQELYEGGSVKEKCENSIKPSLRNQCHQTASFNPFTIKVTPEFQKYVSKRLSKLLDDLIDYSEALKKRRKLQATHFNSGIKLLHSSKNYLKLPNEEACLKTLGSHRKKYLDKIDFEKRAKEVAVSPDWVLSKEETRNWAPDTKGEIEIVKLSHSCHKGNFSKKKIS